MFERTIRCSGSQPCFRYFQFLWKNTQMCICLFNHFKIKVTLINSVFRRWADSRFVHIIDDLFSNVTRFVETFLLHFCSSEDLKLEKQNFHKYELLQSNAIQHYIAASFCSISYSNVAYFAFMSSKKSTPLEWSNVDIFSQCYSNN